jgi:hypothetical protein
VAIARVLHDDPAGIARAREAASAGILISASKAALPSLAGSVSTGASTWTTTW